MFVQSSCDPRDYRMLASAGKCQGLDPIQTASVGE
jgi:hypothetical protein